MDAFCERLIKGMETTNRKIEEKTSCWYAVYTAVKAEKSVKEQLDKAGIESYLPLQSIVRSWNNRKRKVMVPVIPGCVFVRLPMDEVTRIKSMKGISFLIREEGRYVSIPEDQMETFRSMVENTDELVEEIFEKGGSHFLEMSGGEINATELIATLINQKENLVDGISYALEKVDGSVSLLLMNKNGIYCARDKYGRTPVVIGKKEDAFCVAFECFSYKNLGYNDYKELGPGEITVITDQNCITLKKPGDKMKICTFLWVYYGYPASSYEGTSVEQMRYNCGAKMAERDSVKPDIVAGVPDSGIAHAVGYANASGIPFSRPFIKYTPTWPRSFMPTIQSQRNLIAKMKLLAVEDLIRGKSLLLIDDSIVRGTQLRETTEYLFESGAKEVHIRPACPPLVYGCKYLNFSRSSSEMDLITRRVIERLENGNVTDEILQEYTNPDSEKYEQMVDEICKELKFTSLRFNRLDDMLDSCGIDKCKLCTYCWDGKE